MMTLKFLGLDNTVDTCPLAEYQEVAIQFTFLPQSLT